MADRFYGKFRGLVQGNRDPLGIARLEVSVPDVLGEQRAWAMPCLPFTSSESEAIFALPPVGTNVWIEFEQGDRELPIWTGCYWTTAVDIPDSITGTDIPPS